MDKIVKGLELVEKINDLIKDLQKSLELFKRGRGEPALEKIRCVEERIEDLELEGLPARLEIETKLSEVRSDLEWVSDNAGRVRKRDVD